MKQNMNLNKIFSRSIFLLLITILLVSCDRDSNNTSEVENPVVEEQNARQAENETTKLVAQKTDALLGQTVTIRSDALEVVEPFTFTLSDKEYFGGEDIIVVNASGEVFVLPEGDTEVQVTGEVAKFIIADLEADYGLDFDPVFYTEYNDRPAIIAKSLAPAPEPGEITKDPTPYYGQAIAVTGEIEQMYDSNIFTLDEDELFGGEDLLVVVPNISEIVEEGQTVAVTGEVRSFTLVDLETDYDLTWDLDIQEQIEAEYTNKTVFVADQVYPSAIPEEAK